MKHFGIISPPVSGHIHPMAALGREMISRGYRVTYFQVLDLEEKIRSEGLDFEPIGESAYPRGSLPASLKRLGQLGGLSALRFTIQQVARTSAMTCRDLPAAVRRAGADMLLVDQMEPAGGAVAEHLDVPFVTICNALPLNREPSIPPPFTPWRYRDSAWARARNQLGYAASDLLTRPIVAAVAEYRSRWKLPPLRSPDESFSKLAQISQMPKEFDFPRRELPVNFHYVGPLRRDLPKPVPFPWERLDGRPLVYASLGTLQNSREPLFRVFAEACSGLDVQLVISHGGGLTEEQARNLPGNPLVVSYAPQADLLARASLTLTHAGLNTVLDSLSHGVPLIAVPITYEQPAIARRIEWSGAGLSLAPRGLDGRGLRMHLRDVLDRPADRQRASHLGGAILSAGGAATAAAVIESAPRRVNRPDDEKTKVCG